MCIFDSPLAFGVFVFINGLFFYSVVPLVGEMGILCGVKNSDMVQRKIRSRVFVCVMNYSVLSYMDAMIL